MSRKSIPYRLCSTIDESQLFAQYVKQEQLIPTENGREARATRLITERASRRIGKTAFEIALGRPRKVGLTVLAICRVHTLTMK